MEGISASDYRILSCQRHLRTNPGRIMDLKERILDEMEAWRKERAQEEDGGKGNCIFSEPSHYFRLVNTKWAAKVSFKHIKTGTIVYTAYFDQDMTIEAFTVQLISELGLDSEQTYHLLLDTKRGTSKFKSEPANLILFNNVS